MMPKKTETTPKKAKTQKKEYGEIAVVAFSRAGILVFGVSVSSNNCLGLGASGLGRGLGAMGWGHWTGHKSNVSGVGVGAGDNGLGSLDWAEV